MLEQANATASGERKHAKATGAGPLALVVDDELPMQRLLQIVLAADGMRTVEATSGAEAIERAAAHNPDLVLLDLGLPDSDGIVVTRRLREWMAAPILVISARGQEQDKVAVLDAGANDYLTKPFSHGELLARVHVWLRHSARVGPGPEESILEVGDIRMDLGRRLVWAADREVHLTPTEYKLLATLMRHRGCVLTHRQLLESTWGPRYASATQYVRVYMGQLRQKLEQNAAHPRYLLTEPGVGYRLCAR
jgi:two-component system, OmpR family, KDP operon response regulator KdpE